MRCQRRAEGWFLDEDDGGENGGYIGDGKI